MAAVDSRKDSALFHQRIQNNNQRTHFSKKCKWEEGEWRERTELRRKWGEAIHDRRRLCCKCMIFRRQFLKHKSTRNGLSTRNRATTTLSRSDDVAPMVARGLRGGLRIVSTTRFLFNSSVTRCKWNGLASLEWREGKRIYF